MVSKSFFTCTCSISKPIFIQYPLTVALAILANIPSSNFDRRRFFLSWVLLFNRIGKSVNGHHLSTLTILNLRLVKRLAERGKNSRIDGSRIFITRLQPNINCRVKVRHRPYIYRSVFII